MARAAWSIAGAVLILILGIGRPSQAAISSRSQISTGLDTFIQQPQSGRVVGVDLKLKSRAQQDVGWVLDSGLTMYEYKDVGAELSPREAYLKMGRSTELGFGRKLIAWSRADEFWHLGLWQPRGQWDRLHMEAQGLTGFFFDSGGDGWRTQLMLSPVFVPEMGPPFKVKNGHFRSSNPWFQPPPEGIYVDGFSSQPIRLHYQLKTPDIEEIINNPGFGLNLKNAQGLSLSYGYKPVNQLAKAFDLQHVRVDWPDVPAEVDVHVSVIYHHLLAVEWAKPSLKDESWGAGLTYEAPEAKRISKDWTTQTFREAVMASMAWGKKWSRGSGVELGIMKVWGGDGPDRGRFASNNRFFQRRIDWSQAVRGHWTNSILRRGRSQLLAQTGFTYDLDYRGGIFSPGLEWNEGTEWKVSMGYDFVGALSAQGGESFVRDYEGYDRFHAGVSYAF